MYSCIHVVLYECRCYSYFACLYFLYPSYHILLTNKRLFVRNYYLAVFLAHFPEVFATPVAQWCAADLTPSLLAVIASPVLSEHVPAADEALDSAVAPIWRHFLPAVVSGASLVSETCVCVLIVDLIKEQTLLLNTSDGALILQFSVLLVILQFV